MDANRQWKLVKDKEYRILRYKEILHYTLEKINHHVLYLYLGKFGEFNRRETKPSQCGQSERQIKPQINQLTGRTTSRSTIDNNRLSDSNRQYDRQQPRQ